MKIYRVQLYCCDYDEYSTHNTKYFTDKTLAEEYKKKLTDWSKKLLRVGAKANTCINAYINENRDIDEDSKEFEHLFKLRFAITELPQFQSMYWMRNRDVDLDTFEISDNTDIVK